MPDSEDGDTLEEAYESLAAALRIKQDFQRRLIEGLGVLPGEHLDDFADRIVQELQSWRSGARRRALPSVESIPDVISTAAALARDSWDPEVDHGDLMKEGARKLAALADASSILLYERDTLRWFHAEAAFELDRLHSWAGLMSLLDEHWPDAVFRGSSGDPGPTIVFLLREVDRERASRQAWAAEAMRLEMELEQLAEFAGGQANARRAADRAEASAVRKLSEAMELLEKLADPTPCDHFDHHGACQTHGSDPGDCGHEAAKRFLSGFSRPVCAVHQVVK